MKRFSLNILCALMILALALPATAKSRSGGISTLRDDETEEYLHALCDPVFRAAGLQPEHIRIILVNNPSLNAYVAGGQNIFIHTGLIVESEDPNMLLGVLAHETGHIRGGHLVRKREDMENASAEALIGYALGLGSMLAGASPGAAAAAISGGQHIATRDFLRYSRGHEEAADQAALELLRSVKASPRGLMRLLEKLGTQQTLLHGAGAANPYLQSHPLFPERITHIRTYLNASPAADYPTPEKLTARHARVVAKLRGFMDEPKKVLAAYPATNSDIPTRYARSIAHYRTPDIATATKEIDSLISDFPTDGFFHELKGQMLFENGYIPAAVTAYKDAVEYAPDAPMIRLGLASALIAQENKEAYRDAAQQLQRVTVSEPHNVFAWHMLGIAYGRLGELGNSYLSLAEEALLRNKKDDTKKYLELAEKHLTPGSPSALKALELHEALDRKKRD